MIINNRIIPGMGGNLPINNSDNTSKVTKPSVAFGDILNKKIFEETEVKFSKHAESRLKSRNIDMSELQKEKLNEAVNKAGEKNVKDSLIMMDDLAFVVNVKNKTVVTVLNQEEMKENVFTNIDGAVIA